MLSSKIKNWLLIKKKFIFGYSKFTMLLNFLCLLALFAVSLELEIQIELKQLWQRLDTYCLIVPF